MTGKLVRSPGAGQEKELVIDSKQSADLNAGEQIRILGACDPEVRSIFRS